MNKLEKYKENRFSSITYGISNRDVLKEIKLRDEAGKEGFDAAIALNLPIKFATFMRHECVISSDEGIFYKGEIWSAENLYKYWIDNIYKPE